MRTYLADLAAAQHPDVVGGLQLAGAVPPSADLSRGVAVLEQQMRGVERNHVLYCVAKLITGFNERLDKETTNARCSVWFESCGDLPTDLWSAATIELLQSWERDKHFGRVPEPSDLRAIVHDRLARRSVDLNRLKQALARANAESDPPESKGSPIRVRPVDRLKQILREQLEAPDDGDRLWRAAQTERSLSLMEKRRMEPWAADYWAANPPADSGAGTFGAAARRSLDSIKAQAGVAPETRAQTLMASSLFHRGEGRIALADRHLAEARALAPAMFVEVDVERRDVPEVV